METDQSGPLQRWRDARDQLDHALEYFLESTSVLNANLPSYSIDPALLEKITLESQKYLRSMPTRIENLRTAQIVLKKIHNRSPSVVPISKLPPEVLLHIFRLSTWVHPCSPFDHTLNLGDHYHPKRLFTLTHVCTHWGMIIVNTPSLWSHIYFDLNTFNKFSKSHNPFPLCFERAYNQPLCVTLDNKIALSIRSPVMKMITSCLRPHLKRLVRWRLLNFSHPHTLSALLILWLTEGQPGSVHSLSIFPDPNAVRIESWRLFWTSPLSQDYVDSFLLPIRELRTAGVYFGWDSLAYHNLVILRIGRLTRAASPTLRQILAILSACPDLEILQLFDMLIVADEPTPLQPVVLSALKAIDVLLLDPESIRLLLPMIAPRSQGLSVRVGVHFETSGASSAILSFLIRSDITKLYLQLGPAATLDSSIVRYLSSTPNIHTLILDLGSKPGDASLEAITNSLKPGASHSLKFPKLHTLYLINGSLRNETVQGLVEAYPAIKKLRFLACFLEPFDEELLYWLKPLGKDVKCATQLSTIEVLNWHSTMN